MKQLIDSDITEFDLTTDIGPGTEESTGTSFDVELSDRWASLVGIHGGYMAAIATRGAAAVVPDRPVRTVTTSFQRSGRVGPARLHVEEVRRGASVSTVVAELFQRDRVVVSSRITLLAGSEGLDWGDRRVVDVAPVADCVPIAPPNPVEHFHRAHGLLDPSSLPFSDGPDTEVRGWVRPLDGRRVDAAWLVMVCDWFPPPAFVRMTPPVGGISVDMVVHIHRTLEPLGEGWIAGTFGIETSHGGLAVEHGRVTTADGLPIADSMQTRWTIASRS